MRKVLTKEKILKISILIGTILVGILFIYSLYKVNIFQILRNGINEAKREEIQIQTKAQYQIMKANGEDYEIVITIENQNGIEKIVSEDLSIEGKGKNKIAIDKKMREGEEYRLNIKAVGEEEEEYVLIATSQIPVITITNMDVTGDGTTKGVKIEYPNNEKFNNYYSLDDGITWQEYSEEITALEIENKTINAKVEVKEAKTIQNVAEVQAIIVSDSLLSAAQKAVIGNNRHYRIAIKDEVYPVHTYVENGDTTYTTNKTYGDANDAGTASANAKNMVLVKVNGDLTVNSGVTVTSYGTSYGGTKGMLLYVTGTLENRGTITMTARGAKAEGQNVYLWKNADASQRGEYEFVPKIGALGGTSVSLSSSYRTGRAGATGGNGTSRKTGGGASGAVYCDFTSSTATSGRGGNGTSYSGGSGGGGARNGTNAQQGSDNGGAGGNGARPSNYGSGAGGGAGNPGGGSSGGQSNSGGNGTGGLLILYGNTIQNRGTISSNGAVGGSAYYAGGGSSGGGSINIFYNEAITRGTISAAGGSVSGVIGYEGYRGGAGGSGSISIGNIVEGTYSPK